MRTLFKMTKRIKYGNTINSNSGPPLTAEQTEQVIQMLLSYLRQTPEGETYVFDLRFGSDNDDDTNWEEYTEKATWFKRSFFERSEEITRAEVEAFLREDFADVLTMQPRLRRVK